jgi:hypothetical protein
MLDHMAGTPWPPLSELAAYAGLRRVELRWRDIDSDGGGTHIGQTIVDLSRCQAGAVDLGCPTCGKEHPGSYFKSPESEAGERWVPLAPSAQAAATASRSAA